MWPFGGQQRLLNVQCEKAWLPQLPDGGSTAMPVSPKDMKVEIDYFRWVLGLPRSTMLGVMGRIAQRVSDKAQSYCAQTPQYQSMVQMMRQGEGCLATAQASWEEWARVVVHTLMNELRLCTDGAAP